MSNWFTDSEDPRYNDDWDDYNDDSDWDYRSAREREWNDRLDYSNDMYERGEIDATQRTEIRAGA